MSVNKQAMFCNKTSYNKEDLFHEKRADQKGVAKYKMQNTNHIVMVCPYRDLRRGENDFLDKKAYVWARLSSKQATYLDVVHLV